MYDPVCRVVAQDGQWIATSAKWRITENVSWDRLESYWSGPLGSVMTQRTFTIEVDPGDPDDLAKYLGRRCHVVFTRGLDARVFYVGRIGRVPDGRSDLLEIACYPETTDDLPIPREVDQ